MNERQLESFIAAADKKSFSKAAKSNYISVQALIQQIDILEDSLGFELFIRSKRGVSLTNSGEIFYPTAKQILSLYYEATERAKRESSDKLCIAVPEEQYPDFLLDSLKRFCTKYPDTHISFLSAPMSEHFHLIRSHKADCSFLGEPSPSYMSDLSYEALDNNFYAFAMNPSHRLAEKSLITKEDLTDISVYCGNYAFMKQTFMDGLKDTKANRIDMEGEYDFSLKSKVLFSDALLVFPASWKSFYSRSLKVIDSDIAAGSIGILYRKRAQSTMDRLISHLKEEIRFHA